MPKLSDTMTEGVVAMWHKKVGDKVKNGELLADIETDKATMEFESFYDGTLLYIGIEKGKAAPVDSLLCIIGNEGEDISKLIASASIPVIEKRAKSNEPVVAKIEVAKAAPAPVHVQVVSTPVVTSKTNGRVKASPLAKKLASEKGLSVSSVSGSGDGGRVVKRDIENYQQSFSTHQPVMSESFRTPFSPKYSLINSVDANLTVTGFRRVALG